MTQVTENLNIDLKLGSYDFELPEALIATRPIEGRVNSKLLVYDQRSDTITHAHFHQIGEFLASDTLLVANQTKVFPCRLIGQKKETGGKVELFLLEVIPSRGESYQALVKARGKKKVGDTYVFGHDLEAVISEVADGYFYVTLNTDNLEEYLDQVGKIPIPPYIRGGESDEKDKSDYQTVFAKHAGSVAAPTAGLHFTPQLLADLKKQGIDQTALTLHVGLGTFAPVKVDDLSDHTMHTESYFFETSALDRIEKQIEKKNPIVCVGTTSLRALESSWVKDHGPKVEAGEVNETNIFLHPGVEVNSIDGLITNFHLPKSTLLMLVSSLIGREKTLSLYREAIEKEYRFFSYGDAMLILRDRKES